MKHRRKAPYKLFVETKMGIVTRFGDWFHITSDQIEQYFPGLLQKVELWQLVKAAQSWVKSADSLAMLLLLVLLFIMHPLIAGGITFLFHIIWYYNKSSFVTISLNSLFNFLYKDAVQFIAAFVALSYLAIMSRYIAVGTGLLFFFILKLGFLKKFWDKIFNATIKSALSLNDRVMKMIILKFAIYEDVAPEEIQQMEERIRNLATSRKKNR